MTFTLKNREKTITNETMQECIETFVKEYEEAENEIQSIRMDQANDPTEYFIISGKKSAKDWYDSIKKAMVKI
tara:strand:- start:384 stop:602 length:219 start_codon:yes stop_codon:yes gene_type:complete